MISCLITLWTRKPELASTCTAAECSATCIRQRDVEMRPSPCPCSTPFALLFCAVLCCDHSNRSINNDHPANRGSGRFSCRNPLGPNTINSCRMIGLASIQSPVSFNGLCCSTNCLHTDQILGQPVTVLHSHGLLISMTRCAPSSGSA